MPRKYRPKVYHKQVILGIAEEYPKVIRDAIAEGKFEDARFMLGNTYKQIGRAIESCTD